MFPFEEISLPFEYFVTSVEKYFAILYDAGS